MGFFSGLFKRGQEAEERESQNGGGMDPEYLLNELERVKEKYKAELETAKKNAKEQENRAEEAERRAEEQKEKDRRALEQAEENLRQLQKKLNAYEGSYVEVYQFLGDKKREADAVLTEAKKSAEEILLKAREEASQETEQAKGEIDLYRMQAEEELDRALRENMQNIELAKHKIIDYLNNLNRVHGALADNYKEMGRLVNAIPMRLEDVFSESPLDIRLYQEKLQPKVTEDKKAQDTVKLKEELKTVIEEANL